MPALHTVLQRFCNITSWILVYPEIYQHPYFPFHCFQYSALFTKGIFVSRRLTFSFDIDTVYAERGIITGSISLIKYFLFRRMALYTLYARSSCDGFNVSQTGSPGSKRNILHHPLQAMFQKKPILPHV